MTTTPQWINRLDRKHQAEAVIIWEAHRKAVREAQRAFNGALEPLRAKRDKAMASTNERYREAKRALRDRAAEQSPKTGSAT